MKIIGLMSGTSADGLDIALCDIQGDSSHLSAQIVAGTTVAYHPELRQRIIAACDRHTSRTPFISELHSDLGRFMGQQVRAFLDQHSTHCDLIASHGQTIWHNVDDRGTVTSTLQIGSAAHIAESTGITTISDFRSRDVAAGGQGAPLTAYVDYLLLRHPTHYRAIQNIGGMGNVSLLPPQNDTQTPLITFDTGAGNVLIDRAMQQISAGRMTYDHDGRTAERGSVDRAWLAQLMQHDYYHRPPPKTTGRELFSASLADTYLHAGRARGLCDDDIIATLTALTAESIAHAYRHYAPHPIHEVIVGGGGARNPVLMQMLADVLPDSQVHGHDVLQWDSDYKEALVFAVLAHETWHYRPSTLPQQTGARHASILGSITPADNYLSLLNTFMQTQRG